METKPQVWDLSRLYPETSTKMYTHEFGFCTELSMRVWCIKKFEALWELRTNLLNCTRKSTRILHWKIRAAWSWGKSSSIYRLTSLPPVAKWGHKNIHNCLRFWCQTWLLPQISSRYRHQLLLIILPTEEEKLPQRIYSYVCAKSNWRVCSSIA